MHLEDICEQHDLDCYAEIDDTLTYAENKNHLLELAGSEGISDKRAGEEALADLERQAADFGRRVITDKEHEDLVELKRLQDQLRAKAKKLTEREKRLSLQQIEKKAEKLEEKIEKREKPEQYELGKLKRFQQVGKKKPEQPAKTTTTQKHKGCYIPKTKCARSLWMACRKRKIGCPKCQRLIQISCRKKRGGFPKFPKF
jgi:hypothetical protein